MNLSAPFIHRPVMTTFLMLSIIIMGVWAFFKLPVNDLPNIEKPIIEIHAGYPGANPETVLNLVTIPLEKELTHVKGVQEMSSHSSEGSSSISLSFDFSKDMNEAIRDVQSALSRVQHQLPSDLDPQPSYHLAEGGQEPILYFLLMSDSVSVVDLRSYADSYILPRLSRLEGVSEVVIYGSEKSIWVKLNPLLMSSRGIGFNEVIAAIKKKTAQIPLGSIQTASKNLSIELEGTIKEAKELENILIGKNQIKLKDIAEISEKSPNEREFHFGENEKTSLALILAVKKVSGGNTVATADAVNKALEAIKSELPASIELRIWFDKAIWIKESLLDVQWTLLFAFLLVVFVIYLSLGRISESLITSAALPMSLLGTFIVMYLADFSLDLLSLLALTLAVGFVVDDAIVVLENIVRFQDNGANRLNASLLGAKQICFTIFSMTLSLVAVFIPILFMEGMNGRIFREFSLTLAVAILVSGFISLTLTPMLCSRFLSNHASETKMQKWINRGNHWMIGLYGKTLRPCFKYPKTVVLFAFLTVAATIALFTRLPVSLIPPEDRGYFYTIVSLPPGLEQQEANGLQMTLEKLVLSNPSVEKLISLSLQDAILLVVNLLPIEERPPQSEIIDLIQTELDKIPGIQGFIQAYQLIDLNLEFGHAGQYKMLIKGSDFASVEQATKLLAKAMQENSQFTFVKDSISHDAPVLAIDFNEKIGNQLGFEKQDVQELLQSAYGQGYIGKIQKGATQERIYLDLLSSFKDHRDAPNKLYLTTAEGELVPLKALVSWKEKLGAPSLNRREQLPSASIRFSLVEELAPNEGLALAQELANTVLPPSITADLTGSAKATASTINHTLYLLLAAAVVMYVVLGILYESFVHPLTILSSIPFAGLGGVLTLYMFDEPISIFSAVGFLLLIGIVKKNGIMMVDYAIEAQRGGSEPEQAVFDACLIRFRPIMMTTIAAVMGAVPIALGFGDGAEMRRGLGLVIIGGLVFSQLLTLYITPVFFLIFDRFARFTQKKGDA